MSGLVGLLRLDGSPIDQGRLRRLTEFLRFRGPDAENTWSDGSVGFGHTLLRTTFESANEKQPCSLDGKNWIVADARVDDRAELIRQLEGKDRRVKPGVTDPELILHAYMVWGADCVAHLLGDFAFAVWDAERRMLFCARDQLGVKPFYYAQTDGEIIISNTLDCVRMHPAVSDELDERAVADFLLFNFNHEPTTTTFQDIRRLAPAHCLVLSADSSQTRRYWQLPVDGAIRYKRKSDYVEHFHELFRTAVDDRLRTDRAAILMSGGLDSTSVAAVAKAILSGRRKTPSLHAYTAVYDCLFPDEERRYAGLAARSLGIPIAFLAADDYDLYERWGQPALLRPEPVHEPHLAAFVDQFSAISSRYRVVLTGWDGDAVLNDSPRDYFHSLVKTRRFGRLLEDMTRYVLTHGAPPPIGLRSTIKRLLGLNGSDGLLQPAWLNPALSTRLNLKNRLEQVNAKPSSDHPLRPRAYMALQLPAWVQTFECYDPGTTAFQVEARHPFVDLRLLTFLLSIPAVPLCVDKALLRMAMRGLLPEAVRTRPKTPLRGYPVVESLRRQDTTWIERFEPAPALFKYVDKKAIPRIDINAHPNQVEADLRPLSLNLWMNRLKCGSELTDPENLS